MGPVRTLLLGAGLSLLPAVGVAAADAQASAAAAPGPVDPARLAAAREVMMVMRAEEQTRRSIDASMGTMMHGMADRVTAAMPSQNGLTNDPEFKAMLQRFMDRIGAASAAQVKAAMPQLIAGFTDLYARNFDVAQLHDMAAFYRTPTGQAVVDKLPEISGQVAVMSQQLITPGLMAAIRPAAEEFQQEAKAWAAKHPELKGGTQ